MLFSTEVMGSFVFVSTFSS